MAFEGVPETPEPFDKKDILLKIENVVGSLQERLENAGQEISEELAKFYEEVVSIADSALSSSLVIDRESFIRELKHRETQETTTQEVVDFIVTNTRD